MARDPQVRAPQQHYSSQPLRAQRRWSGGFYTGEPVVDDETRRRGERPHGWGRFEMNYDLPSSELRRVDIPNHRGKGPKGYRRTDARTREIICDHLMDDPRIDASDIEVQVQDDEVRLTGTVADRRTKFLVEDIIESATGAANIVNLLRVV